MNLISIETTRFMRLFALLLTCILTLTACGNPLEQKPIGATIDPPRTINDIVLTNQDGVPWGLRNLRDRVVLMAFAYTHCPDICPLTMVDFRRIKTALGDAAKNVEFVFISVDGARDTPSVIKQYLSAFDPTFIGLTGPPTDVQRLTDQFGARFQAEQPKSDSNSYVVAHTSYIYALDKQGRWRITFAYQSDPEQIAAALRPLVDAPAGTTSSNAETFGNIYAGIPAKAIYVDTPSVLPDIALKTQLDAPFHPKDLRGKYALLFFGAISCRNDCRNLLPQFATIKAALGSDTDKVQFVMLSVDGERDTPDKLRQFMQAYDPTFLALTGDLDAVVPFAIKHGIHVTIDPATSNPRHAEPHPVYSILLAPDGRWIVAFPYSMAPEAIADVLKNLLRDA